MASRHEIRDPALLDAISSKPLEPLKIAVWRIVRSDRDPLRGSSPKGRWDDGTIEVLYTSQEPDGAKAEMHFHLSRGQPVFPSKMKFTLFEIEVSFSHGLDISDKSFLAALGIDETTYGSLGYLRREEEYRSSQRISEAAHFLGADAIIVPNARWTCKNVVLFLSRIAPEHLTIIRDHGEVNWIDWKRRTAPST